MSKLIKRESASKERGISLVESLLVLGIAASFITGGIALFGQATQTNEARDAINQIYAMVAAIKPAYSNRDSFDGLNGTADSFGVGESPWGGTYAIASYDDGAAEEDKLFGIHLDDVPAVACTQIFNTMDSEDDFRVVVANTVGGEAAPAAGAISGVTDFATAATTPWDGSCMEGDDNTVLILGQN